MSISSDLRAVESATKHVSPRLRSFIEDQSAQDIVEYALVAMLIGLGCVAAMRGLAASVAGAFVNVQTALTSGA